MKLKTLIVICFGVLISSCGKMPETHYFSLEWQELSVPAADGIGVLHIQAFDAAPMLKYDKMMYKTSLYQVKYDNYRRWVMAPGSLLTQKAAEYFQSSGLFENVVLDVPRGMKCLSLFGRVNHFEEIDYAGQHKALISITFELTNFDERQPLFLTSIKKEVDVQGRNAEDIVAAMSQATRLVFEDLQEQMRPFVK